jgi:enoyl-CoA hydratase
VLHLESVDGVAVLRMEHGKVNALDLELSAGLGSRLREVEASAARALILTGAGGAFSAGVDLFRVLDGGADYLRAFMPALCAALTAVFRFPRPVVAAVNGHAIAGGCILACACDYRVMASGTSRLGVPELPVGVPFPPQAIEILRFAVPPSELQPMIYSGRTCPADEALARRLVDEVVEPDALMPRSLAVARQLAATPAASFELTKRTLRAPAFERLDRIPPEIDREVERVWATPEVGAAIRAFLEKTVGRNRR